MRKESLQSEPQSGKNLSESIGGTAKDRTWLKKLGLVFAGFWLFAGGFAQGYIFNGTFREVFWQDHKIDPLVICEIQLHRMNEELMMAQGAPYTRTKDDELRKALQRNMGTYRSQHK